MFDLLGRYTTEEMSRLWNMATQYHLWQLVEVAAAEAQGLGSTEGGAEALALLKSTPSPAVATVAHAERETRHDVAAFLKVMRGMVGGHAMTGNPWAIRPEEERRAVVDEALSWVHRGMTSSDVVDSANAVRWQQAGWLVSGELERLAKLLAKRSISSWEVPRVGRTHGQWAEETTWGMWFAEKQQLVARLANRVRWAAYEAGAVKMSGPVGDHKRVTREEEERFAELLGAATKCDLHADSVSSQIVSRDRLVAMCEAVAMGAKAIESLALEVRLSSQPERGEWMEPFGSEQIGSSAMPHKRNPVCSEKLAGLSALVNANAEAVKAGLVLWGERDISHSSVERVAVPIVTGLAHYQARQACWLVERSELDAGRSESLAEEARKVTGSAAAVTWLQEQGVEPGLAWRLVAGALGDEAEMTLGWSLPKAARRWLKKNPDGPLSEPVARINWAKMETGLRTKGQNERVRLMMEQEAGE